MHIHKGKHTYNVPCQLTKFRRWGILETRGRETHWFWRNHSFSDTRVVFDGSTPNVNGFLKEDPLVTNNDTLWPKFIPIVTDTVKEYSGRLKCMTAKSILMLGYRYSSMPFWSRYPPNIGAYRDVGGHPTTIHQTRCGQRQSLTTQCMWAFGCDVKTKEEIN